MAMKEDLKAKEWLNNNELSYKIWNNKYRNGEESFDEWLLRVSGGNKDVANLIANKKFLFGGRILANRGVTDKKITYSNCYVISPPEDTLESIFECASKLARTFSYGGGCGIDISKLRPNGAVTHNAAKMSSGPVSFMDIFSQITGTISQAGRRGALMISLDINHPDVEEFIDCKTNTDRVLFANISVRVNDAFMKAVEEDSDYLLRWPCENHVVNGIDDFEYDKLYYKHNMYLKKVKARRLFEKLARNNWNYAEPGILYWDRIQGYNLLDNTDFKYAGVNPCAEEPLPAGGSCLLGSLNLAEFVFNPFTDHASVDWEGLLRATRVAVQALNEVLLEGLNLHPLKEQRESVNEWRQIGLGTMGLGDMLIKLGVTYGSDKSIEVIDKVYSFIAKIAVTMSADLAADDGKYPKCDVAKIGSSKFMQNLQISDYVKRRIETTGLFNSQLLTCAPTGSIATMLGVSTGVEPIYAMKYTRMTKSLEGKDTAFEVYTPIAADYLKIHDSLPEYFVESAQIKPIDRIKVQGALQKVIDASISSTINLPKEATVQDVYDIYLNAWKYGLKGVTIYRSGCAREAILSATPKKESSERQAPKRPKSLPATYEEVKVKGERFAVIIGMLEDKPYEIFTVRCAESFGRHEGQITKISKGVYKFTSDKLTIPNLVEELSIEEKAATLYTSMLLRHGVHIQYILKTAKKVNDNILSFSSAMCRILSKYLPATDTGEKCPNCGAPLINEGGCIHCSSCEFSRCE